MTSMPNEQLAASLVSLFFSFKGRINRARFWIGTIPLVIGWIAAMALFNWMFMRAESLVPVYGFGIAAGVMLLWGQLGVCNKRLHDRGKSGWWLSYSGLFRPPSARPARRPQTSPCGSLQLSRLALFGCGPSSNSAACAAPKGQTPTAPIRCRRGTDARLSLSYSGVMLAGLAIASRDVR